jgi:pimeloyl-ACP methyl ester carboxylesterase
MHLSSEGFMTHRFAALTCTVALVAACADSARAPMPTAPMALSSTVSSIWAVEEIGTTGPGSIYGIYKPFNWNGEAIYYAHGFVDAAAPVQLPTTQDGAEAIRDALGAMGYAVAMSSYSSNGYDFADGLRRTHQLRGLLRSKVGVPTYEYLAGHSLGAQISVGLAEKYGKQYDGALLMCGVLGGSRLHFQWVGDVRVLFDLFYPGVLPGDVTQIPPGTDLFAQIIGPAQAAILNDPTGAFTIAAITQSPLAGNNPNEVITSLLSALGWHARGINDVTARAQGHPPYDNIGRVYTSPLLPPATLQFINAQVGRFASPPDAQQWLDRNFEPTGKVSFPVLTLHTTRDQAVPFFHTVRFGALTAQAGASNLVVQRAIDRYGHCAFTPQEVLTAFSDLFIWVKAGVAPTP